MLVFNHASERVGIHSLGKKVCINSFTTFYQSRQTKAARLSASNSEIDKNRELQEVNTGLQEAHANTDNPQFENQSHDQPVPVEYVPGVQRVQSIAPAESQGSGCVRIDQSRSL